MRRLANPSRNVSFRNQTHVGETIDEGVFLLHSAQVLVSVHP
jgi:hypothetical protein